MPKPNAYDKSQIGDSASCRHAIDSRPGLSVAAIWPVCHHQWLLDFDFDFDVVLEDVDVDVVDGLCLLNEVLLCTTGLDPGRGLIYE